MRRGGVYLFVIIVMVIIFTMLTLSLTLTSHRARITHMYVQNSVEYNLAVDAIKKRVSELNHILRSNATTIHQEIFNSIEDITSQVFYEDGFFYLKQKDIDDLLLGERNNFYSTLFINKASNILSPHMINNSTYRITIGETVINITVSIVREGDSLILNSIAHNWNTNHRERVRAVVKLLSGDQDEYKEQLHENYIFREVPFYLQEAQFIINDGDTSIINEDIDMYGITWEKNNAISHHAHGESIDISKFYNGGLPSVLILDGYNTIYTGDSERNRFHGIIYTNGVVNIESNVNINGIVIAKEINAEEYTILYENNLLDVPIQDRELRRKLYDFFNITNFAMADGLSIHATTDIELMLGYLKLSDIFGINITSLPTYQIIELQEI